MLQAKPRYSILTTNPDVALIGDPHIGKRFQNGVPLSRRGERERHQKETLLASLHEAASKSKVVVMLGDLFDQYEVVGSDLFDVYEIYTEVASKHPSVMFIILRGNHDVSRYVSKRSSFDILEKMLVKYNNLRVITAPQSMTINRKNYLFIPYDAFLPTEDLLTSFYKGLLNEKYHGIFGHWDLESFGGDDFNLIPCDLLLPLVHNGHHLVTGHVHTPSSRVVNSDTRPDGDTGVYIIGSGSMLPYSHGEDPGQEFYVSVTLEEYHKNPSQYHDKCLRLMLKAGEVAPEDVDALQITTKYVDEAGEEEVEVKMGEFSFRDIFGQSFLDRGLDEETIKIYWAKYQEKSSDDYEASV